MKIEFLVIFLVFMLFVGVSMSLASCNKDMEMALSILLSTTLILYFSLITFLLPKVDKNFQHLLRQFASTLPLDVNIATYKTTKPSLIFYSKRPLKQIDSIDEIQEQLLSEKRFAFISKKKYIGGLMLQNSFLWGENSKYVIYTNYPR